MINRELKIQTLIKLYSWSREQIDLGLRAHFKCEYCDKELFENIDNYKLWEVDHIIPISSNIPGLDYDSFENKAISCRQCNTSFKSRYNPVTEIGSEKTREEYILNIRQKIAEKRRQKQAELDEFKRLLLELQTNWNDSK